MLHFYTLNRYMRSMLIYYICRCGYLMRNGTSAPFPDCPPSLLSIIHALLEILKLQFIMWLRCGRGLAPRRAETASSFAATSGHFAAAKPLRNLQQSVAEDRWDGGQTWDQVSGLTAGISCFSGGKEKASEMCSKPTFTRNTQPKRVQTYRFCI